MAKLSLKNTVVTFMGCEHHFETKKEAVKFHSEILIILIND